jgi:hypothetical protein
MAGKARPKKVTLDPRQVALVQLQAIIADETLPIESRQQALTALEALQPAPAPAPARCPGQPFSMDIDLMPPFDWDTPTVDAEDRTVKPLPPVAPKAPAPAPDPDKERFLEHYRQLLSADDLERAQAAETVLRRNGWWTEPQPVTAITVTEPPKPETRDISGYQKAHEYYHGKAPEPMPQGIQVDFAGTPQHVSRSIEEVFPGKRFWEREEREARGRALSAKRTEATAPRVVSWSPDLGLDLPS